MSSGEADTPNIRFYNSNLLSAGTVVRIIAMDLTIMPRTESEIEKRVMKALVDYNAAEFERLLKVTQASESELGYVMKHGQIIDW